MGFWKNIGLFNMLTAKTPGDFLVGSLIVEDEIQKEKQETKNSIKLEKTVIKGTNFNKLKYKKILGSAIYRIGIDMPEGIYKVKNSDEEMTSYYCIYNQAVDSQTQIISNGNFKGIKYIEVQNGNYLELDEKVEILAHKPLETKVYDEENKT